MVTQEVSPDGSTLITDPDKFNHSISAKCYRLGNNSLPVPKGSLTIESLQAPVLETHGGVYSSYLSATVTPVEKLETGVYIVVCSTFNPQCLGKF